jgi:exonuclease III
LSWNVRGINSRDKWNIIRDRIVESECDILCLQETKKDEFDQSFLRNICPPSFDSFEFLPSVGASGGIITIWKGRLFSGELIFNNEFAISVEINSKLSDDSWILTNVYGPCTPEGKQNFTDWLRQIQMPEDREWIVLGDFNLIRKPEDRNRGDGNMAEMFMFNENCPQTYFMQDSASGESYSPAL